MSKKLWTALIIGAIVVAFGAAYQYKMAGTQTPKKPKVIGAIYFRQHLDAYEGLKEGMKTLGYTDQDVVYNEILIVPGPTLAQDMDRDVRKLITDKVDVIFVTYEDTAKVALNVTKELGVNTPIVFTTRFHDPLAVGLINSFKSSGNNSTGVATNLIESVQKNLSFFKEINPKAKKVGVFTEGFMVPGGSDAILKEIKAQAPRFELSVVEYKTQKPPGITKDNWYEVANKIKLGDIDAIYHLPVHFFDTQETEETLLARRLRIPLAAPSEDMPTGGSFSYSDDFHASASQAAAMIKKIFSGTKPKDIPVEFGAKSLLILNEKRAKAAGFKFPASMISIAQVIEK
jgi:ABC-type uncharacterized transport system substrate-binding protein